MNKRETGLDIVRTLAVIFVVIEHFYLSCGYYNTLIISIKLYIMTYVRWALLAAVPLFMILTGYFKKDKVISKKHYMSLIPIITAYLIISVIRMLVENRMYGKIHSLKSAVQSIFNYQCAWYVGMYVSIMLIIPFLNKMWHGCKNKKEHLLLIGSFAFISMLYPIFLYVAPSYWQMLYPITYYFIGAYFATYKPKPNKLLLVCAFLISAFVETLISLYYAKGGMFKWEFPPAVDMGNNMITIAICACCVFLLFYDVDIKNQVLCKFFKSVSGCSLEIYLFQTAVNAVLYTYAKRIVPDGAENYFWLIFIFVPISFLTSWILSIAYQFLYHSIYKNTLGKIIQ